MYKVSVLVEHFKFLQDVSAFKKLTHLIQRATI